MPCPDCNAIERDRIANELRSSFLARLEVMNMMGKNLAEEYREKVAQSLIEASLTLIPSDHLMDHQFVVSRGVFDAAKRHAKKEGL